MKPPSALPIWPQRLQHDVPGWVKSGAVFHIRLRAASPSEALTNGQLPAALIGAARNYHDRLQWYCSLFLVMPDHVHMLVSFPCDESMARVIGSWKRFVGRTQGVTWQSNFFDHRIRNHDEMDETWAYIRRNPVVKGLCATEEHWPWSWNA